MPNSLRAGGCTFAEDPAHNCAVVRPIWSATLDPCVLSVRVVPPIHPQAHVFDRLPLGARRLIGPDAEYLAFNRGGAPIRLDVVAGSTEAAPFGLRFDIADDADLGTRLLELQRFRAQSGNARQHDRLAKQLLALRAIDAHDAGASLKEEDRHSVG